MRFPWVSSLAKRDKDYDLDSHNIFTCRDVLFKEDIFPFQQTGNTSLSHKDSIHPPLVNPSSSTLIIPMSPTDNTDESHIPTSTDDNTDIPNDTTDPNISASHDSYTVSCSS